MCCRFESCPMHNPATGGINARDGQKNGGEMPSEKFWSEDHNGHEHCIMDIGWSRPGESDKPGPFINGAKFDRSGVNRMITVLRRARDQVYGADA